MMRRRTLVAWFVILGGSMAGCAGPVRIDDSVVERNIWALEEAYWVNNRDANYEGIVSTWHDRFLGWPDREDRPIDAEQGARYVREEFKAPASYEFEIDPLGFRLWGDVAVNYYRVWIASPDPDQPDGKSRKSLRIVHTWVLEDGRWKVLGGMSHQK